MTDGFRYFGQWVGGEMQGNGTATYANGDIYVGAFKGGVRQGQGKLSFGTGEQVEGKWDNGELTEPAPSPEPSAEGAATAP